MFDDPYYNSLYEEIMELEPPPKVEGSYKDFIGQNPDELLEQLEARLQHSNDAVKLTSGLNALETLSVKSAETSLLIDGVDSNHLDMIQKMKDKLRSKTSDETITKHEKKNGKNVNSFLNVMNNLTNQSNIDTIWGDIDSYAMTSIAEKEEEIIPPSVEEWNALWRTYGANNRALVRNEELSLCLILIAFFSFFFFNIYI